MILYIQNLPQCRRCKVTFKFNNRLHKYFKKLKCLRKNFIVVYVIIKIVAKDLLKSFAKKFFANNFFSITIIKKINVTGSRVMQFIVDFDFDLNINYDFRDWTHVKANIIFSENATLRKNCLDIKAKLTLIDRTFFKKQTPDMFI